MSYDKMNDFIGSVYNVFTLVNKNAETKGDKRSKFIAFLILGYVTNLAKQHNVDLKKIEEPIMINLIPFFEYVSFKNIELFEFDKIKLEDVDTSKPEDIERFVLSHVYYITQK